MHRDATSGHLYYTVQGGWNGKIIVDQGHIKSVTYRGVPLGASELGALKFRKAVVVPGLRLSSTLLIPQKPPEMEAVLTALETAEASAEDASGVSTKRAAPEG